MEQPTFPPHPSEAPAAGEASYRLLFERNPAPMLIYERGSMQMVAVNDAFVDHYGYRREEALALLLPDLYPEVEKGPIAALAQALSGPAYVGEWHHLKRDGAVIVVAVRSHDIPFAGRNCRIAVVTDITESKRAELERQALFTQLVQAQKMEAVGQLAGGVAHDFNNILTAMLMQIGTLQEDPDVPEDARRIAGELEAEARRAADLTRQLLMFSRRQVLQTRLLEINSLLGNLLKMVRRLIGEHVRLELLGPSGDLWLDGDPGMLEQVVMNLVVNARDAMPSGGRITLSARPVHLEQLPARRHPDAAPGHWACLSVADTGCGMDAATLGRIFEPFFTTKEAGKGTGLGLATAYGIVRQHRGWIEVESEPGRGSTFCVYLPARRDVSAAAPERADAPRAKGGDERILLAEDEHSVRVALADALRKLGYRVWAAGTGVEALALWAERAGAFDLLISDVVMPGGLTGIELADRLGAARAALPVILMSGYSPEMAERGVQQTATRRFLQKPFATSTLTSLVRDCLDQGAGEGAPRPGR